MADRRSNLLLLGLTLVAFLGVLLLAVPGSPIQQKPKLGLDLQGGLEIVLRAVPPKDHAITDEDMARSVEIMRARVDKLGVSEPEIRKQGSNQIVIQLPASSVSGKTSRRRSHVATPIASEMAVYSVSTAVP